jgi:simple sugar transport system permease protein
VRLGGVQVDPVLGAEIEFVVVAVIGGCLLTGGYGSTLGASSGALLCAVAREGITGRAGTRGGSRSSSACRCWPTASIRQRLRAVPRS